jgi:hypothetical protein
MEFRASPPLPEQIVPIFRTNLSRNSKHFKSLMDGIILA